MASITKKATLPRPLKFTNNHNGTATISGLAKAKKAGTYSVTFSATFGKGKTKHTATQAFTLTIT